MPFLNYHHLRYFRFIAREKNLTRAAAKLNLSVPALSIQLKQLEESLGHPLFDRVPGGLDLTEAGSIALGYAEEIARAGEELMDVMQHRQHGGRQILRVGAVGTLSRNFLLEFLQPALHRADVEVILRSGSQPDLLRALEAIAVDVVLTNLIPSRDAVSPYLVHKLSEQPVSIIGTPDSSREYKSLRKLVETESLILPTPESALRASFDGLLERLGVIPRIAAEADDMAMLRLLARTGAGLAVIPPIVVRDELESGMLVELARLEGITESFFAVTLQRRFPNPLVSQTLKAFRNKMDSFRTSEVV